KLAQKAGTIFWVICFILRGTFLVIVWVIAIFWFTKIALILILLLGLLLRLVRRCSTLIGLTVLI
ncbi:hypothetical protein, partial [Oenococcus oeni]|uniref:hypothetical protein n=1 Tax=Oenococcus oeni TaxID=1247 RepID=UPI001C5A702F